MSNTSLRNRRTLSTSAVALTTAGLMALGLGAASAHVTVAPASTTEDGYSQLTFSVPNESETAATNKLEVQLPTEQPFTSVRVRPVEGWTAEVVTGTLPEPVTTADGATLTEAPLSVVWTAEPGAEISQQEYQTFSISVGRLPEAGTTVVLPATQSYTDGDVVEWDDEVVEGAEEPEKPAPSFLTTAAVEGEDGHGAHGAAAETPEAIDAEPAAASTDTGSASAVGWIGLVAGLLGLAAGATALVRTRRQA
ncbi:YcnI family protein [Arthrobacter bussei]|uniref:YcnI family protein n=1 Tax=Arthrobacter bussei TaxID=2594179 RepID=A0A7X1TM94_9MICC|nr:YcnI family protein [Arthrobacter bussei]MPY09311.1 YcnI family protein [Arthrobacter bussei]